MKKIIYTLLIALLILPALVPWMPHGVVHAMQDYQKSHHQTNSQIETTNHDHANIKHTQASGHHPIHLDAVTYFSDFLHVDLQTPEQIALKSPNVDSHDFDFPVIADLQITLNYKPDNTHSRAPPDWRHFRPDNIPPYSSTQRIRI
jgi:hypothetical protein